MEISYRDRMTAAPANSPVANRGEDVPLLSQTQIRHYLKSQNTPEEPPDGFVRNNS